MGHWTFLGLFLVVVGSIYFLAVNTHMGEQDLTILGTPGERYYEMPPEEPGKEPIRFNLVDPEVAPEDKLKKIVYGFHLMLDTKKNAPEFCHNDLDCKNCHFLAGNSLGGKQRGIALVGVTTVYPRYSKRDKKKITLPDRIDNCFRRSMNGKSLPHDSYEMQSILAYLEWISHEVVEAKDLPWLGLPTIESTHIPDAVNGEKVYERCCAICHGKDGEGTKSEVEGIPPLWGPNSFNDGAGMNTLPMLSAFVYLNMPYGQPTLSEEEALDVAAYVVKQPRPHFNP